MTKKVGWKNNFKSIMLNTSFASRILVDEMGWDDQGKMLSPILFTPRDFRRLAQAITWTERFRILVAEARRQGHRIDHVLVNKEGENKILCDPTFVAAQLTNHATPGLGFYMGVNIFSAPQQTEMIVFVIETPQGFFTVTGNDVQPFVHPGPIFVMEIKP